MPDLQQRPIAGTYRLPPPGQSQTSALSLPLPDRTVTSSTGECTGTPLTGKNTSFPASASTSSSCSPQTPPSPLHTFTYRTLQSSPALPSRAQAEPSAADSERGQVHTEPYAHSAQDPFTAPSGHILSSFKAQAPEVDHTDNEQDTESFGIPYLLLGLPHPRDILTPSNSSEPFIRSHSLHLH
ncbi:hypothetical protein BD414DRAFT_474193 [Trametes punicea]|nr:hypothetical protein BD414DRAFT_474193 [Trametes punicea]